MMSIIKVEQLKRSFVQGKNELKILTGIDLEVSAGEQVAIIGASGSGKSTLLHLLGGLDKPTLGKVVISGEDLSTMNEAERARLRNKALGFVYQFHHLLPEFTALENVAMPLLIAKVDSVTAKQKAGELLQAVGLGSRLTHKPAELSGGERQRTAIARAMVTNPDCVLADEPTGNLDQKTAAEVFELMKATNQQLNSSLVIVTHDMDIAKQMQKGYILSNGQLTRDW